MKEKALALLRDKFNGVSDSILVRVAAKVANGIADESALANAVDQVTFQQVLESYGDSRANEAQQTAVRNYEQKHNLKDGKPYEKPDDAPKSTDGIEQIPAWAQMLIDDNKQLKNELASMKGQRTAEQRRTALNDITQKLPQELRKAYDRIPLESLSNEEFETMKGEITEEVKSILDGQRAHDSVFGRPTRTIPTTTQGQTPEATDAEVEAVMKLLPL